ISGMSHEPKSPSLGMISTATRTTATVSPLTPSPLNGSIVPNGSPAAQSGHSGFAAALRKLAKQAEEPRGSSISSESSPVSSPATNHSSPVSTPKRGPMGPVIVPPGGHNVPSTPPVVTIAPTKTVNGLWRSESRQTDSGPRGSSRDRLTAENALPQEKGGPSVPAHLIGNPYAFGLTPGSIMPDSRFQPLNLPRQIPHTLPPAGVPEEYLRGFRPYATPEDLRMPSLPLGLDPATAAAAAAYYHPGYLPHPSFSPYRMDDPFCLSALRSPFYPLPGGGALPPLHPSAVHMHLPGVRYPGDLSHPSLSGLQSERLTERYTNTGTRRREREREREKEREREREAEREKEEREREREREREKEREREREKERAAREKELQMSKGIESHYLAELHALRGQVEDRAKPGERLTPNRSDKTKEPVLPIPKPIQHGLHQSLGPVSNAVPSLVPSHPLYLGPPGGPGPGVLSGPMLLQRTNEEERWLARQRKLRQEKEDRQYQVSEFRQQVLEQHLDLGRPGEGADLRIEGHRDGRDLHLGAPPPLISPKPQQREHIPPPPPTTLWNPASLIETPSLDSRRSSIHDPPSGLSAHYDLSRLPSSSANSSGKSDRLFPPEKLDEGARGRKEILDRFPTLRPPPPGAFPEHGAFLAELEKSTQSFLNQQRASLSLSSQNGDLSSSLKHGGPFKGLLQGPPPPRLGPEPVLIYDEFLQQHRRPISKLDLEEKRKREAREKGYYYELDDSYDESDEEEVRAHLRRVAEQPPLKLDESTEKVEFLCTVGLTTVSRRDDLMEQKRRKRRRMLRERSPSPPSVQSKRAPPPLPPLSTRFTPEEMDNAPELEDKKRFLTMFSLSHVTVQQRRDSERVLELLQAIRQKNSATVQPHAESDEPPSPTPSAPRPPLPPEPISIPEQPKSSAEPLRPKDPSLPTSLPDKARLSDCSTTRKPSSLLNSMRPPLQAKEDPASLNGRTKPWESFTAEEFAQQFHESVLQSTQKALQKSKGGVAVISEPKHTLDSSVHYNIPELQSIPGRSSSLPQHLHSNPQSNGQHCPLPPRRSLPRARDELSPEEDSEDEEYDYEEESPGPRWQGIEAIFEAYHEYIEEQSIERQVLQNHCRRLEANHYNLSLTAEQLSHTMGELMAQKQKLAAEREKMQAELEHFRKCLSLPQSHWSRSHFKGYPPR
uniref:Genetic suppressor element-like domain-containing protein n=1 Tax=Denticeps clupeoides TaxID=299321 RepID=A0AAY4BCZ4_9TELE